MPDFPYSFGWIPDLPDNRDYTREHPKIAPLLAKLPSKPSSGTPTTAKLLSSTDLRSFCSPVFDQGSMGSCTANAAAGMLEYHNRRTFGKDTALSRLFIYKATRDLMLSKGDSGAYIRATMGSLALCGCPPEKYWGYEEDKLDVAPPAFCYSYASNYQALSYFRLDEKSGTTKEDAKLASLNTPTNGKDMPKILSSAASSPSNSVVSPAPAKTRANTLLEIKQTLASSLPVMFGFTVYDSIKSVSEDGRIPYPTRGESVLGGHAVLAVGYDDNLTIGDKFGAFLIRNSWGEAWGEKGYGWLPYEYLLGGLAEDWWCLVKAEWMETEEFGV